MNKQFPRLGLALMIAATAWAADWTEPVHVRQELKPVVSYRARWDGAYLIVQATHDDGFHTYAMDNVKRAEEKLAGKQSLGIDSPTQINVSDGLLVEGGWQQTPPKDLSKPELRWYTWGYDGPAVFVAKARRTGAGPARIAIRGQACTDTTCKNIDVTISLPLPEPGATPVASDIDLKSLIPVR
ncbi:MAG: hypothetical protein JJE04_25660 [Acidobacteriia bacterium]|nr:hypothetical protein [Terriglobia bacterium]